jgi:hypothetical protein
MSENQYIVPKQGCKECSGSGLIDDEIDDGERRYHFSSFCDCVTSQMLSPDVIVTVVTPQDVLIAMILDEPVSPCPEVDKEEQAELWADIQREADADWLERDREYFRKYT